jgi:6-O-methylguanine DNA methyltransferase, DNA binding domain
LAPWSWSVPAVPSAAYNPLSIVVPCHRVVAADRSLCGYGGGIEAKRWLLDHEASVADAGPKSNIWVTLGHDKWPHRSRTIFPTVVRERMSS